MEVTKTNNGILALWLGIAFSFAFTALIWLLGPSLPVIDFLPDAGASWYYWQLPEPTFWSRTTAWGGYLGHQIVIWLLIYHAQKSKLKYSNNLHKVNILALAANAFFIFLHLIQTHIWYDGLAQDVSIFSSQGSVVLLLVMVLLMENQRRGLFFGKKVGFLKETARVARKYHGYIFAWGVIYTFWYHPMETTSGHLIGFLYTFFLMLQGSLFFTRVHVNRWWMLMQELIVLVHGTLVAYQHGNGAWAMFFFGFATIFIVTQMHGLGLKLWQRWAFVVAYIIAIILVYSQRGWELVSEVIRVPVIEYALVFILALIIWLVMSIIGLGTRMIPSLRRASL